jgi:hypothetical protein
VVDLIQLEELEDLVVAEEEMVEAVVETKEDIAHQKEIQEDLVTLTQVEVEVELDNLEDLLLATKEVMVYNFTEHIMAAVAEAEHNKVLL